MFFVNNMSRSAKLVYVSWRLGIQCYINKRLNKVPILVQSIVASKPKDCIPAKPLKHFAHETVCAPVILYHARGKLKFAST